MVNPFPAGPDMTIEQQLQAGLAALQAGDGASAAAQFRPIAEAHPLHPQVWMMLAEACRINDDPAGMESAADRVIAIEPRAVRAYGWKGDARLATGDKRGATRWYREGLAQAAALSPLPDALTGEVERLNAALAQLDADFGAQLREGLVARAVDETAVSDRFAESMALLRGQAQVQLQQPKAYYLPGLAQRAFFEREEFAWAGAIEAATDTIRAELLTALASDDALFTPYMQSGHDGPVRDFHGMLNNPDWGALHLIENGVASPVAQAHFPHTLAAMDHAPLCRIGVRAPTIMFSRLKAGKRIPPHHGMVNTRLICHLPLIVPGPGALRCGNQQRSWDVGKLMIFDDSMEHEAWNDADADRIVLIFDVWRPDVTQAERDAVVALFDVIDNGDKGPHQ